MGDVLCVYGLPTVKPKAFFQKWTKSFTHEWVWVSVYVGGLVGVFGNAM